MNKTNLLVKLDEFKSREKYSEYADMTVYNYYHHCKIFINTIQHDNNITKDDVMIFKDYMSNVLEFEATTVNNYIVAINKFLKFCGLDSFIVKKLKVQKDVVIDEIMTIKDFKRMLKFAKKMQMQDMYMIMKVFIYTGIRNYELKYFTYETVSKSCYMSIRNKGKTRTIILRQDLRREILKYCESNNITDGYIFPSPRNKNGPICRSTVWRRLQRIAGQARVKKELIYPHAFRHLFAILYLENGGNPLNLADILGHSTMETTRIYSKHTKSMLRDTLENIKL